MMLRKTILLALFFVNFLTIHAQQTPYASLPVLDYSSPREYEIAGVEITGVKFLDKNIILSMTGLEVGNKITVPGDAITSIINKFWLQGLFADVKIIATKIENEKIWLEVFLKERPRLAALQLVGVKKADKKDLEEKINRKPGSQVNDNVKNDIVTIIRKFYREKGYLNIDVNIVEKEDTTAADRVYLITNVDLNSRVKIREIDFVGNEKFKDKRLRRTFKKTHQFGLNILKTFKFVESKFSEDKNLLTDFYKGNGYKDFSVLSDTIEFVNKDKDRIKLTIHVSEGNQYFLKSVQWIGNTVYSTEYLNSLLKMEVGGVYDPVSMEKRIQGDEDAVSNVYLDNGYLFSSINPVEAKIANDSVEVEMRVVEGPQATINKIIIQGNTKTNERVVQRELFVKPGELFSRANIIRDVRQIAQLGFFDETKINPLPIPDPANGTVDIVYQLEEKANDQLELSAGWGSGMVIGRIGLKFNNFSMRNAKKFKNWRPVPTGDGQQVGISWQTNGKRYSGWNLSFVEPWLGGHKPNSLSVNLFHSSMGEYDNYADYWNFSATPTQYYKSTGITVGLGKRIKWPDDYFSVSFQTTYQRYKVKNWVSGSYYRFPFTDGISDNFNVGITIQRNSINAPLFPTRGSLFSLGVTATPPWSMIQGKNYKGADPADKYRLIEYHKWSFKAQWYKTLIGKLVLGVNYNLGYLGFYDKNIGVSPYEGYVLGGSGMQTYRLFGQDIISLRGYKDYAFWDPRYPDRSAAPIYVKTNMEFRYPVVMQTSSSIYVIAFLEGGNAWYDSRNFNPINVKRAAGIALRAYLPMFGMMGVDWGYGFDDVPAGGGYNKSQFQFTLGQQF